MFSSDEFNELLGVFQGVLPDIQPGEFLPFAGIGEEGESGLWARFFLGDGTVARRGSLPNAFDLVQEAVVIIYLSPDYRVHRGAAVREVNAQLSHWSGLMMGSVEPLQFIGEWRFAGGGVEYGSWDMSGTHPYLTMALTTVWRKAMPGSDE